MSGNVVRATVALSILIAATLLAEASTGAQPTEAAQLAAANSQLAQNSATECVNGYRVTHRVASGGGRGQGVILKCKS
jgi:hypothetical protein